MADGERSAPNKKRQVPKVTSGTCFSKAIKTNLTGSFASQNANQIAQTLDDAQPPPSVQAKPQIQGSQASHHDPLGSGLKSQKENEENAKKLVELEEANLK